MLATAEQWVWVAVLAVCVSLDSLFCGMESGVYALNKIRLDLQADLGKSSAVWLQKSFDRFDRLLATLLIGTNLARYTATFAVSALLIAGGLKTDVELVTLAIVTPALFVIGDSVPKSVFRRSAEALVPRFVWLLRVSGVVFTLVGIRPLVSGLSTGLLRLLGGAKGRTYTLGHRGVEAIVAEGHASGLLTDYQSAMVGRAMQLADLRLRDVMVPITQTVTAPAETPRGELVSLVHHHGHSRLPLEGADGAIVGILDVLDLLTADKDRTPASLARDPLVLPDSGHLSEALLAMKRARRALAIVADASGRHVGVVTVKDIAEEIVGELAEMAE